MAWFDPETLTCPDCGRTEQITWLCSVPLRLPDRAPTRADGSRTAHDPGGWRVARHATDQSVTCPDCGTEVGRCGLTP